MALRVVPPDFALATPLRLAEPAPELVRLVLVAEAAFVFDLDRVAVARAIVICCPEFAMLWENERCVIGNRVGDDRIGFVRVGDVRVNDGCNSPKWNTCLIGPARESFSLQNAER